MKKIGLLALAVAMVLGVASQSVLAGGACCGKDKKEKCCAEAGKEGCCSKDKAAEGEASTEAAKE